MRFQVPQFIEEEDKIFGQFTFKQFVYIAGGVGLSFIIYYLIGSLPLSVPLIIPVAALSGLLAFKKPNGRPFSLLLESFFYYLTSEKLYIWKKENKIDKKTIEEVVDETTNELPPVTQGSIRDLALRLDIQTDNDEKISDRL